MKSEHSKPDLLEVLQRQLCDALRTVSLIKGIAQSTPGIKGQAVISNEPIYGLFINGKGRKASESDVREINPKDYALYLDTTSGILGFCVSGQESQVQTVEEARINGVEDILGAMIEYPHLNFGNINISLFLPHRAAMTPDAFRKAIAKIRNAIQEGNEHGPLLRRFNRSHFTVSKSGYSWRISGDEGNLCLIRFLSLAERFRQQRRC